MAAGVAAGADVVRSSKCRSGNAWPWRWAATCLVLAASLAPATAYNDPRYVLLSSPTKKKIYYAPLPDVTELEKSQGDRTQYEAQVLIDGEGGSLVEPQGLAVWHGKDEAVLYVADTQQKKIFAYSLSGTAGWDADDPMKFETISAGDQKTVAENLDQVSGLALDGFGNLYYSTLAGVVGMFKTEHLHPLGSSPTAEVLYETGTVDKVQKPYALAADNFHVYWANSENGQNNGVLVSAFERDVANMAATYPDYPKMLAQNAPKAMGVCVARSNVFFTAENQVLYGVKAAGGSVAEVYQHFASPRGCAYDGEGTLYVADEDGSVYSLPGNMQTLQPIVQGRVQKVINGPTDMAPRSVVVFTRAEAYMFKDWWGSLFR